MFRFRCRSLRDDLAFFVPCVQFDPALDQGELLIEELRAGAFKSFPGKIRDRGYLSTFGHPEGNNGWQEEGIEE